MKLTKTQRDNLNRIWTERIAYGFISEDRQFRALIDSKQCAELGFAKMHSNAMSSLVKKGLARILVTKVTHRSERDVCFVRVLILTEAGRKAIGV